MDTNILGLLLCLCSIPTGIMIAIMFVIKRSSQITRDEEKRFGKLL